MKRRHFRWQILLAVVAFAASSRALGQVLVDDFETGTALLTDNPAGHWSYLGDVRGSDNLSIVAGAGRNASRGLRYVDSTGGTGENSSGNLQYFFSRPGGDLYFHYWFRFTTTTNNTWFRPAMIHGVVSGYTLAETDIPSTPGPARLGGFNAIGDYTRTTGTVTITTGTWHLMELVTRNVGTTNGVREMYVDGQLAARMSGINWSAVDYRAVVIGEPWGDFAFRGQLDFDFARVSATPIASRAVLGGAASARLGDCLPLQLSWQTSDANTISADRPMNFSLSSASGDFYADAQCSQAISAISVATGAAQTAFFFKPTVVGPAQLRAEDIDLLPAVRALEILESVAGDGGTSTPGDEDALGVRPAFSLASSCQVSSLFWPVSLLFFVRRRWSK